MVCFFDVYIWKVNSDLRLIIYKNDGIFFKKDICVGIVWVLVCFFLYVMYVLLFLVFDRICRLVLIDEWELC